MENSKGLLKNHKNKILMSVFGTIIGFINGIFGAGGGMLVVPAFEFVFKKQPEVAHATAILVILPVTLASAIVYIAKGIFDLGLTLSVGSGVVVGGVLGAMLLGKLKAKAVRIIFSILMIFAGIKMAFF